MQFTQAETHAQIVRNKPERSMFILIHEPTQSHTQTVDFRSMPEKNQWMVGVVRRGVVEEMAHGGDIVGKVKDLRVGQLRGRKQEGRKIPWSQLI